MTMTSISKTTVAFGLTIALGSTAFAQEYTKGEVTKIDAAQKELTIKHEELKNLDMPAMTMVFVVADDTMLEKVNEGESVEFVAERVNGRITVTEIK
jgi:Cu/Ag efflux protein CusF